jgi:hypothetical protein
MQLEDCIDLIAPDDRAPQRNQVTQMLDEFTLKSFLRLTS